MEVNSIIGIFQMDKKIWKERIKYFLLGIFVLGGLIFLTGAKQDVPLSYGRYQISAWGTPFGNNSGGCGAFVVDTATGETKVVYTVIYGKHEEISTLKNNLKKPFYSIE